MNILVKQNKNNKQQKWLNDLIWNTNQCIEEIALVSVFVSLVKMLLQCAWHGIDGHVWDTGHVTRQMGQLFSKSETFLLFPLVFLNFVSDISTKYNNNLKKLTVRQGKFIYIAQFNNKVIQSALQRH